MNEFKIGDKVVVLTDSKESVYDHGFGKGDVGTVKVFEDECVWVSVSGKYIQVLHPSELELVNE